MVSKDGGGYVNGIPKNQNQNQMEQVMKQAQKFCLSLAVMVGVGGFAMITPRASAADIVVHIGADAAVPSAPVYHYMYYPDEEVYFYPATGVYFWFGGGGWHKGRRLPPAIVLHEQARVNVRLNTRVPYERHEEIRARYPAHAAPHEEPHPEPMEHGGR